MKAIKDINWFVTQLQKARKAKVHAGVGSLLAGLLARDRRRLDSRSAAFVRAIVESAAFRLNDILRSRAAAKDSWTRLRISNVRRLAAGPHEREPAERPIVRTIKQTMGRNGGSQERLSWAER